MLKYWPSNELDDNDELYIIALLKSVILYGNDDNDTVYMKGVKL